MWCLMSAAHHGREARARPCSHTTRDSELAAVANSPGPQTHRQSTHNRTRQRLSAEKRARLSTRLGAVLCRAACGPRRPLRIQSFNAAQTVGGRRLNWRRREDRKHVFNPPARRYRFRRNLAAHAMGQFMPQLHRQFNTQSTIVRCNLKSIQQSAWAAPISGMHTVPASVPPRLPPP